MAKVTTKKTVHITLELSAGESEMYEEIMKAEACLTPENMERVLQAGKGERMQDCIDTAFKLYLLFHDIVRGK